MSGSCTFCKIASGEGQASIVHENRNVMAFMDLYPANVGHTLVMPKEHWETIYELPEEILADLFVVVKRVAIAVKKAVNAQGINIVQSNERAAFQLVRHLHVHVIPRFEGDAITKAFEVMVAPTRHGKAARQALDRIAKEIKQNL